MIVSLIYSCPICRCSIDFLPLRTQLAIGLLWNFHLLLQKILGLGFDRLMTKNAERAYGRSSYVQLRRKLASRKQLLPSSFPFPFFLLENGTIWWDGNFFLEKWTRNCCEDNDKVDLGSSCIGRSNMIWEAALFFFSECFFFPWTLEIMIILWGKRVKVSWNRHRGKMSIFQASSRKRKELLQNKKQWVE